MSETKDRLVEAMKAAMKAKDKSRLGTVRLALAELKQREVDERKSLSEDDVIAILDKMVKQRRDSVEQFTAGGRDDLAAQEQSEIEVLQEFLPEQLSAAEIEALVDQAIEATGAEGMAGMGKVMGALNPQLKGRADMKQVSGLVRSRLTS